MKLPFIHKFKETRVTPQNNFFRSTYSFLFGPTTSGKTVNERTAMQTTAVYACVRILVEAIASLPLSVYQATGLGKEKAINHNLYHLLHDEPNSEMTSFVFRETLMSHLLLWGNAYAQIIRNQNGKVLSLYPLLPNKMSVNRDTRGNIYYVYTRNSDETPSLAGYGEFYLSDREVLHIPGLGFEESSEPITTEGLIVHAIKRGLCIADFHEMSIGMILEYIRRYDTLSGITSDVIDATQTQFNNF